MITLFHDSIGAFHKELINIAFIIYRITPLKLTDRGTAVSVGI